MTHSPCAVTTPVPRRSARRTARLLGAVLLGLVAGAARGADGDLDRTFGGTGIVTTDIGVANGSGHAALVQPDGKLVIAGDAVPGDRSDSFTVLLRINADGTPDATFGRNGTAAKAPGITYSRINAIARQADGKLVVAGGAALSYDSMPVVLISRYLADGSLDASFGTAGVVLAPLGSDPYPSQCSAQAVAIQADGRIVAAGTLGDGTLHVGVLRLLADGTPDASFGSGGTVLTEAGGAEASAAALAIQGDGRILVGGNRGPYGQGAFLVMRLLANGTLDSTFGSAGVATQGFFPTTWSADRLSAIAVQADGRIVAAGTVQDDTHDADFAATRFLANGSVDAAFADQGIYTHAFSSSPGPEVRALAIQGDQKLLIAGTAGVSAVTDADMLVIRLLPSGQEDGGFGAAGVVHSDFAGPGQTSGDGAEAVLALSDGRVVAVGTRNLFPHLQIAAARYRADGSPDPTFAGTGRRAYDVGHGLDQVAAVAVQADRKVLAAGTTFNGRDLDLAIARYLPSGALDQTFAQNGLLTVDFPTWWPSDDGARDLSVQADGRIVVAAVHAGGTGGVAVLRYLANGAPDQAFGTAGSVEVPIDSFTYGAMAVQADGRVVVVGSNAQPGGTFQSFKVMRFTAAGVADPSFGSGGLVSTVIGGHGDVPTCVAIQPDGRIVVAGGAASVEEPHLAVVRYLADGRLDPGFGSAGMTVIPVAPDDSDRASRVVVQADGRIVVAGFTAFPELASTDDTFVARLTASGALDGAFASGGIARLAFRQQEDQPVGLGLQADGRIVLTVSAVPDGAGGQQHDVVVARLTRAGVLDASFGQGGQVVTHLASESVPAAAVVTPDQRLVVGATLARNPSDDFLVERYLLDTVAPTLAITPNGTATTQPASTLTFAFSEAVSGFSLAGMTVSGATAGALSGSGATYTLPITASGDGVVRITVATGAARDAAGNASAAASATLTVDRAAPLVAITAPGSLPAMTLPAGANAFAGTASDAGGLAAVTYRLSGASAASGTAAGTATWRTPALTLAPGTSTLTVTARDRAGNSAAVSATLTVLALQPAAQPAATVAGLDYEYDEGVWSRLPAFAALDPTAVGSVTHIDLAPRRRESDFALLFTGYLAVPGDGVYTFSTSSDDGSRLALDGTVVVDNDGLHGTGERSGSVGLKAGMHAVALAYFQHLGGHALTVSYAGPGIAKQVLPDAALHRDPPLTGTVRRDYWTGLPGSAVADLTASAKYPASPDGGGPLTSFEAPSNWADHYGTRLSGYLVPPLSGAYTLWVAGDDTCELWLSGSELPGDKRLIARVPSWTKPRQWDLFPAQRSLPVTLLAGHRYYVEALQKENTGADCLAVGWQLPDGTLEQPIAGQHLAPPLSGLSTLGGGR